MKWLKKFFQPNYDAAYKVLKSLEKFFVIDKNINKDSIAIDWFKLASVERSSYQPAKD